MGEEELRPGLYEWLLTAALDRDLGAVNEALLHAEIGDLADAEASDRLSRHVASVLARTIESLPDRDRAALGANLAQELLTRLGSVQEGAIDADKDLPLAPPREDCTDSVFEVFVWDAEVISHVGQRFTGLEASEDVFDSCCPVEKDRGGRRTREQRGVHPLQGSRSALVESASVIFGSCEPVKVLGYPLPKP
jgi:hypothetical protein